MIVKMKKAKIVVLKEEKEQLLKSLQRYGVLMLIPGEEIQTVDTSKEDGLIQRAQNTLKIVNKFQEKKSFIKEEYMVDYEEFVTIDPKRQEILDLVESKNEEISQIKTENQTLKESISYFSPWVNLGISLNDLSKPKYASLHTGVINPRRLEELIENVNDFGGEVGVLGSSPEGQALVFACYYADEVQILEKLKNIGFTEVLLPKEKETVEKIILGKEETITQNLERIDNLQKELFELAKQDDEIKLLSDQLNSIAALKKSPIRKTVETVYLEGWVRIDRAHVLEKAIQKATDIYDLELVDPLPNELPPTEMKNNKFVEPFESITTMLSTPNPYEVDPNPVMSFWYLMIFGMMMGDVGYGIVMAILFYGMIKLMRPKGSMLKLLKVLFYGSFTTILWGALFGSYFGFTWNPILLEPMVDIIDYMILTIAIGALHVITGILVQAYDNIKNKNIWGAIYDQFSWVITLIGLGMLFFPQTKTVGTYLAIGGAAIVVLFSKRDLKNPFSRFFAGLYSLYGISSYASDILSYTRILALSLSTAVIGYVMNILAGMLQGNLIGFFFSIIVYIIGHVFNIAMGLLSAYVHDSRLQFIEFYNKFYEGGGYEFKPLSMQLKYVDTINNQVEKES